jgi:hypothetical protein
MAMVSAANSKLVFPACADALDQAPSSGKEALSRSLALVADGSPSFEHVLGDELSYGALLAMGAVLSLAQVQALPPGAQRIPSEPKQLTGRDELAAWERLFILHTLSEHHELAPALRQAAAAPRAERAAAFDAVETRRARSLNPITKLAAPNYPSFAEKLDQRDARVAVLQAVLWADIARASTGQWPTSIPLEVTLSPTAEGLQIASAAPRLEEIRALAHVDDAR